jgi:hypothetical protein
MHRRLHILSVALASLLFFSGRSEAQDFGFSFGGSTVVDHLVTGAARRDLPTDSTTNVDVLRMDVLKSPNYLQSLPADGVAAPAPGEAPVAPAPFWKEQTVSVLYEYRHKDSSRPGDQQTDIHFTGPILHLKTRDSFVLDVSAGYANTTIRDDNNFDTDADSFALFLAPSQELISLGLSDAEKKRQQNFLFLGVGLGYRNTNADSDLNGTPDETETDALTVAPALLMTHVANSLKTTATGGVIYAYETSDNNSTVLGHDDDSKGVASLLIRGDWFYPTVPLTPTDHPFQLWFNAQWNHDTDAPNFPVAGNEDDWAQFGVYASVPVRKVWSLRAGYTIEAFHTDFTQHRVEFRIDRFL